MKRTVRVAFISGGMYDRQYESIPQFEVDSGISVSIDFRGTHPELNAHLASFDEPPYDLVSTHTKYAIGRIGWISPSEAGTN